MAKKLIDFFRPMKPEDPPLRRWQFVMIRLANGKRATSGLVLNVMGDIVRVETPWGNRECLMSDVMPLGVHQSSATRRQIILALNGK